MKSIITLSIAFTLFFMADYQVRAQDNPFFDKSTVMEDKIIQEEKEALKNEVEQINQRLENNEITSEQADALKKEAAEKHALNIGNRLAILKNQDELDSRNKAEETEERKKGIFVTWNDDNDIEINASIKSTKKKKVYDERTSTGIHLAYGFLDLVGEGDSYGKTDIAVGRSSAFELGLDFTTRVFKNSNFLRVKYGLTFQWNKISPHGDKFWIDEEGVNTLVDFPSELRKSEMRFTNVVVPVYLEFGPSRKIESKDYIRYSTAKQIKFGVGGYGGFNIGTMQKLKYREDGQKVKQKIKKDYNSTDFVYGLGAYVGIGNVSVFGKYDLSPLFHNQPADLNLLSLGLRLDFD